MTELTFRKIGNNPEVEAILLQELCRSDGIDDAIMSEFPGTIDTYRNQPLESATTRIVDRYSQDNSLAVGDIAMRGGRAIGLAYSGIADFQEVNDSEPTIGINVSAWLSSTYRGRGFGKQIIQHATSRAVERSGDVYIPSWYEKQVWTSIKIGNIASRHVCEDIGFSVSGLMHDDPGRYLYFLDRSE